MSVFRSTSSRQSVQTMKSEATRDQESLSKRQIPQSARRPGVVDIDCHLQDLVMVSVVVVVSEKRNRRNKDQDTKHFLARLPQHSVAHELLLPNARAIYHWRQGKRSNQATTHVAPQLHKWSGFPGVSQKLNRTFSIE